MALVLLVSACGSSGNDEASLPAPAAVPTFEPVAIADDLAELRDPQVPDLPFADNPDPSQCGIPVPWGAGEEAWLTGMWEGELIQSDVLLYDGHQRFNITGSGPHGAEVEIVLYQPNPVLDYYFVDVIGEPGVKGWVPAPFLSFDPVIDAS